MSGPFPNLNTLLWATNKEARWKYPAHTYPRRKERRAPQCSQERRRFRGKLSIRRTSWGLFSAQINTWAKQACIEQLLELNILIEATFLSSWACNFPATSSPSQLESMCLKFQAKAVTHCFHSWRCFFCTRGMFLFSVGMDISVCFLAFIHAAVVV